MRKKARENKKYTDFVKTLTCCFCDQEAEPHHIIGIPGMGTMGSKAYDIHTMPLCHDHHMAVHKDPSEWPQLRWLIETQEQAVKAGVLK